MGASPLMSLGMKAMSAAYMAMQTTSHNIANANVAGYSRQDVVLETAKGQFTGAGFFGKGVDVTSVTRAHDQFLTRAATIATSQSAMDAAHSDRLGQLEQVFQTGESGLGYSMGQFLNSFVDLASRPGDSATRQTVLAQAQDLATRFNSAAGQLDTIQAGVTEDLKSTVTTVNGLTQSIATLNQQIAAVRGLGQPPNDLLDQRDQLVSKLSGYVQVSTLEADDGTLGVFVAGGQSLVLGSNASQLVVGLDVDDPSRSSLMLDENGKQRTIDPSALGGGSIAGLLNFQNGDLVDGRNLIGQMATAVAGVVNQQQMLGVNLQQPLGSVASQPLFSVGTPQAIPASTNAKDAGGNYLSSVTLTVTDPTAVQAASYELRADPAGSGQYQLTRLSSPPVTQLVNSGDVVDGVRIDVPNGLQPGDRFLLKPVAQAAGGLTALLQDPRDLAAASPLIATTSASNTGTAAVDSLTMLSQPLQAGATAQVSFTSDSGDYSWQLTDASGNVLSSGTGTWQAGQPIPANASDINGFALQLSGVPRNGDVVTIAPTPPEALSTNNGNALALATLRDVTFIGRTMDASGNVSGGATATDAYASAMADIGVRVQSAKSSASISAAVSDQATQATSAVSGVNLDEEAARLIQQQQSYQAAAKVLQVAQSLFETLLQTTTG